MGFCRVELRRPGDPAIQVFATVQLVLSVLRWRPLNHAVVEGARRAEPAVPAPSIAAALVRAAYAKDCGSTAR